MNIYHTRYSNFIDFDSARNYNLTQSSGNKWKLKKVHRKSLEKMAFDNWQNCICQKLSADNHC